MGGFLSYKLYLKCMIVEDYTLCITLGIAVIGIFLPTIKKEYFRPSLSCKVLNCACSCEGFVMKD